MRPLTTASIEIVPSSSPWVVEFLIFLFYQLFWTQTCPGEMGTNGTHRSHARCHPYPIPQPMKVGHTTGVYVPYSFRTVVWVFLRPTWTDQWKCCETGPTVFRPYPRRLESLTICRCHYKGSTFFWVILKDPECWSGRGLNRRPPAQQTVALQAAVSCRRGQVTFKARACTGKSSSNKRDLKQRRRRRRQWNNH